MTDNKSTLRPSRVARVPVGSVLPLILVTTVAISIFAGGIWMWLRNVTAGEKIQPITMNVKSEIFSAIVLGKGEIRSSENKEVKCAVGSRNGNVTVIETVPEGTFVTAGDWLITLDDTSFKKELEQQTMIIKSAETVVIQSKAAFEGAEAALEEYQQGTFKQQEMTIENEVFTAEQEWEQAEAYLIHSRKLQRKGYITKQQLRSDEIAVDKAQKNKDLAVKKLEVLRDITSRKELIGFNGDIAAYSVKYNNDVISKKIEDEKLVEIREQLSNCRIVVPEGVEGEVVFAKEFDRRGGTDWVLEPGATVREGQLLIQVPNREKMEVKVLINEQSITSIRPGMPATIEVDALNNSQVHGVVTKVNAYAEQSGGWGSSSSVREYAVFIQLQDPPSTLITGMNASVSIRTQFETDALQAPLQCIYSAGIQYFVLKKIADGYETVEVTVGGESTDRVWIDSGVSKGDELVMNPRAYSDLMDLPELAEKEGMKDVDPDWAAGLVDSEVPQMSRPSNGKGQGKGGRPGSAAGGGDSAERLGDLIKSMDSDGDGKVSMDEWNADSNRLKNSVSEPDSDQDGEVSREELSKAFEKLRSQWKGSGGKGG